MPPNPTPEAAAGGLAPGVSYYQVLEPSKVLGPGGLVQMAMHGPFLDLGQASKFASARPGSLITVTLVLFQTAAAAAAPLLTKA